VQCKGRVLRVDSVANNGKMAVAAVIEEYEFFLRVEAKPGTDERRPVASETQDAVDIPAPVLHRFLGK